MKKTMTAVIALLLSFIVVSCRTNNCAPDESEKATVTVEIDSGKDKKVIKTAKWREGMTALVALQSVSRVVTRPSGNYVFVTSIDGIDAEYTVTAWYYKVNGKSARKLAVSNIIKKGDRITWILKKDVCSGKINKKSCKK